MAKYQYWYVQVSGYGGREYECLLKRKTGSDQPFHKMPAIHAQTGKRVIIFPRDEVRIFGNEPLSDHLVKWWKESIIERQQKQLKKAKEFFGVKPSFVQRIKSFFRSLLP